MEWQNEADNQIVSKLKAEKSLNSNVNCKCDISFIYLDQHQRAS